MIRFIVKRMENSSADSTFKRDSFVTIDADVPELEQLLSRAVKHQYESLSFELVGAEVVKVNEEAK